MVDYVVLCGVMRCYAVWLTIWSGPRPFLSPGPGIRRGFRWAHCLGEPLFTRFLITDIWDQNRSMYNICISRGFAMVFKSRWKLFSQCCCSLA
jgi:hypothetical protein